MLVVGRKRLSVIIPAPGGGRQGERVRERERKGERERINSIHKWEGERKENKTAAVGVHIRKREIGEIVYKNKKNYEK